MPLSLHIDGQKWRSHLGAMVSAKPGLVPVIKGNGYGFGLEFLADEATRLGVDIVAVGLASEVVKVRSAFAGEIIVLSPDQEFNDLLDPKVIQTISNLAVLQKIDTKANVIIEIRTPLNRHGIDIADLNQAITTVKDRGLNLRGFTLHLPIAEIDNKLVTETLQKLPESSTVWISHLRNLDQIKRAFPTLNFRERIGTSLWLGADSALEARATVLENRKIQGTAGYQQRKVNGYVIVASGGTAHGIGLTAPQSDYSLIGRLKIIARALESSFGKMRSPYRWQGKGLDFIETPHMQCSLITFSGSNQPKPGDELTLRVRYTTTTFDQIIVK
ncbi:Alanine racemase, N-terminal [Candidatus Nanopelagicaceae bacterium]